MARVKIKDLVAELVGAKRQSLLVRDGRVIGRAALNKKMELPKGVSIIADSEGAKIGMKVVRGKVKLPSGKRETRNILDRDGNVINTIVVDPDDLPKLPAGERLEK